MDYLYALVAGLIQGLTEFLPVSSSAHLLFFHRIFGFEFTYEIFFDVAVHLATLAAVMLYFRREIAAVVRSAFRFMSKPDLKNDREQRTTFMLLIGSLPILVLGFLFSGFIEKKLHTVEVAIPALLAVSLVFFLAERVGRRSRGLEAMTTVDAALIGTAQALALVPGVSRSGITVSAGLCRNFDRAQAAKFSFLISIPAMLGAGAKSVMDIKDWASVDWLVLGIGFAASLASGLLAIRFFLGFLKRHPLNAFAWYRIGLGAVVLGWLLFLA